MGKIKLLLGSSILLLVSVQVNAVPLYNLSDLGSLGQSGTSEGFDVNNLGQVTGTSNNRAFLYENGSMTDLGTLGGTTSSGWGINNLGQVVGRAALPGTGNQSSNPFIYQNGLMTDLGNIGDINPIGLYASTANSINDSGQITGQAMGESLGGQGHKAFIYENGTMTDLGSLGGTFGGHGHDISNSGQITGNSPLGPLNQNNGSHAFLYENGSMTDLGTLGSRNSSGYGINSLGQVTGASRNRAFLYENGSMTDLGTLGDDYNEAIGWGISDNGRVVGQSRASSSIVDAFLWEKNEGMLNLEDLVVTDMAFELYKANAISDNGKFITGIGSLGGQNHAFLLEYIGDGFPPSIPITPCETSTITCLHIPEISNLDADDVEAYTGTDSQLTLFYKNDFDAAALFGSGEESGLFKDNYSTEYDTDEDGEPTGADIFHDLGDIINCAECYLVVKDGRQGDPAQYLFDISDSGDLMTLALNGFWDGEGVQGAISNIAIYGVSPVPVPAAVWLFGTALIGLVGFNRRRKAA